MRKASLLFLLPLGLIEQTVEQTVGVATQVLPAAPLAQVSGQESKPEELGSVAGQVADASTGEPLRKVNLVLRRADPNPNGGAIPTSYSGNSDNSGKFVVKDSNLDDIA